MPTGWRLGREVLGGETGKRDSGNWHRQRQRHPLWQALAGDVARSFNAVGRVEESRRVRERGRGTALQLLTLPAFMISPPKLGKVKGRRPSQAGYIYCRLRLFYDSDASIKAV